MNLFLSIKSGQKTKWLKTIAGVVVLGLIVFWLSFFSDKVRNLFFTITLPVREIVNNSGKNTAALFVSALNIRGLQEENENLKIENQRLLSQMSLLQDRQEQDQAVNNVLLRSREDDFSLVLADTVGFDLRQDIITINKGKDNGIAENMAVISQQKVLFGKVLKVYKDFSQVLLISSKNSAIDVKIDCPDQAIGIIKGNGGLSVYLDLVPVDSSISPGDTIITSALDGIFPKGLLVGKITAKDNNDQKPFLTAKVNPFFDIKKSGKLFVITDYKNKK